MSIYTVRHGAKRRPRVAAALRVAARKANELSASLYARAEAYEPSEPVGPGDSIQHSAVVTVYFRDE